MQSGFVSSFSAAPRLGRTHSAFTQASVCTRRRAAPRGPRMMARFQKQEDNNSQQLDEETDLEKIIPPPALPTLTTLTDSADSRADIDLSRLSDPAVDPEKAANDAMREVASMGAGLSSTDEMSVLSFLNDVIEEFKIIEWPSTSRVIRVTFVILVSLIVSVVALYFIDGFFYRMAQVLFDGKV